MKKIACLYCDLLVETKSINKGQAAICPRCKELLYHDKKSLSLSLSLLLTALILYLPSILLPFLQMQTTGQVQEISLWSSLFEIASGSSFLLAATVFILVLLLPLVKFLGLLLIILPLSTGRLPLVGIRATRLILSIARWSMAEVYLIGAIVSIVKLEAIADIGFLGGFYVFALLIIVDAMISFTLPTKRIWQNISELRYGEYYGCPENHV